MTTLRIDYRIEDDAPLFDATEAALLAEWDWAIDNAQAERDGHHEEYLR
jgi:hypothetical protein